MLFHKAQSHEEAHNRLGIGMPIGSKHYRAFVGPPEKYDLVAAMQFNLLTALGLRENHTLLDIGCGSLRAGRLFIPYLLSGNYFGLEPNRWLIAQGVDKEIGEDLLRIKRPVFDHNDEFKLTAFGRQFDYLLAQSIFSHAAPGQIKTCLEEAKKVMHPKSIFVATYSPGQQNYDGCEWLYPECATYTEGYMLQLATNAGLVAVPHPWEHPNDLRWLLITQAD